MALPAKFIVASLTILVLLETHLSSTEAFLFPWGSFPLGSNLNHASTLPDHPRVAPKLYLNHDDNKFTSNFVECPLLEQPVDVSDTVVGYTGSQDPATKRNPTYKKILDYAEAIRIQFDPSKVTYEDLLGLFFYYHTPEDPEFCGSQYRSAIFYHTEEQQRSAEKVVESWGSFGKHVAVEPASDFYRAEERHQKYMERF